MRTSGIVLGAVVLALGGMSTPVSARKSGSGKPRESGRFTFLFRDVPKNWELFKGRGFTMMVPPGLKRKKIQGEDSVLTKLVGPNVEIDIHFGLYAGEPPGAIPAWRDYREEEFRATDRTIGKLISYISSANTASAKKRFAADAYLPEIYRVGRDVVGLSVKTLSSSEKERGWMVTALRSIRIVPQPEGHR